MYRTLPLEEPIEYRSLNGNLIVYNSLIIVDERWNGKPYRKVLLSRDGGCAPYMEIELTSPYVKAPKNYLALIPNNPSSDIIIPELERQKMIVKHPENKTIYQGSLHYPLYRITGNHERESTRITKKKTLDGIS